MMLSPEIITVLVGASPLAELRGAIPLAIAKFNFGPEKAYLLSVVGNLAPIIPILFGLHQFSDYLMRRSYYIHQFLTWLFERTRKQHTQSFELWGTFALFLFTAVPLPFTGAWSACVAAFVFGINFWKAVAAIGGGVLAAGIAVLGATLGVISIF